MSATLDELPDRHVWTFHDHRVTQLAAELGSCRLLTWTLQASTEIRLGADFTLRQADGVERTVDPDEPEQFAPLLTLVGRALESLTVLRRGELIAAFSDGTIVTAGAHPRREAWSIQGGGGLEGLAYRCEPGGRVPLE
jgi:hypothetical protein